MSASSQTGCACKSSENLPQFKELSDFVDALPSKKGHLITVLHRAQHIFGYLPIEVQEFVAKKMDVPVTQVYGVVSFYAFFTMVPKGKFPVSICLGTACFVKGAARVLDEFKKQLGIDVGEVTEDGKFSLDTLRCVGGCALAPIVTVGGQVFGNVKPRQVKKILANFEE